MYASLFLHILVDEAVSNAINILKVQLRNDKTNE